MDVVRCGSVSTHAQAHTHTQTDIAWQCSHLPLNRITASTQNQNKKTNKHIGEMEEERQEKRTCSWIEIDKTICCVSVYGVCVCVYNCLHMCDIVFACGQSGELLPGFSHCCCYCYCLVASAWQMDNYRAHILSIFFSRLFNTYAHIRQLFIWLDY